MGGQSGGVVGMLEVRSADCLPFLDSADFVFKLLTRRVGEAIKREQKANKKFDELEGGFEIRLRKHSDQLLRREHFL